MADAGIGEAAVAEGGKSAAEAGAAEAGAAEAGAGAAAAGGTEAGVGTLGTIGSGAGETAGLTSSGLATSADVGLPGLTAASNSTPLLSSGLAATSADTGLAGLPELSSTAGSVSGLAGGLDTTVGSQAPGLGGADAPLPSSAPVTQTANLPATQAASPIGSGAPEIPGTADPLSAPATSAPTGTPSGESYPGDAKLASGGPQLEGVNSANAAAPLQASPVTQSMLDQIFSQKGLQTANLGLGAASLAKQLTGAGSAQKQFNAAAAPTSAVSNQLLQQFQTGQINGADAYAITQYSQQQKASIDQYYAKAGLSNSSMHQQALAQVDQQAEAMRQQAVQNLLKSGLSAAGVSNPLISSGITAGVNQDAASMKAMQDFIAQLAKMNTPQASQPATTGTPG